jgi:hypothetical protein
MTRSGPAWHPVTDSCKRVGRFPKVPADAQGPGHPFPNLTNGRVLGKKRRLFPELLTRPGTVPTCHDDP